MPFPRRAVALLLALLTLLAPCAATWSILVVDLATGEVAIGIATCVTGLDLRPEAIVVVPGRGVAVAQGALSALPWREAMRAGLLAGLPPAAILAQVQALDPAPAQRQYAIVALDGQAATFTGAQTLAWSGGTTGRSGTLVYAIQGNVLAGAPVVAAAETLLATTNGTLADKLLAAMEAARAFGGDGRCSCSQQAPTACGSPPANFTKAADIGLVIVSRPGDLDAPCNVAAGCGAGSYWLDQNVAYANAGDPDPVLQLRQRYTAWLTTMAGTPDHLRSSGTPARATLRADGSDTTAVRVVLRDLAGAPLGNTFGLSVARADGSAAHDAVVGTPLPQPDGSYLVAVRSGFATGTLRLVLTTRHRGRTIELRPHAEIVLAPLFDACGAGGVQDVLAIAGATPRDRVVEVGHGVPFTVTLAGLPGAPPPPAGLFALWLHAGVPPPGPLLPLGPGRGSLCFWPAPLAALPTLLVADSFGAGGLFAAGPVPWSLTVPGVPAVLDTALQGVVVEPASFAFAATNALLLRVVAHPAPQVANVAPASPAPGTTVVVTGGEFHPGLTATLAGAPLPVTRRGLTQLDFVMPAGPLCDAPLVLHNAGGNSTTANVNLAPVVTSAPTNGARTGGTPVVIQGQHLIGATVTIGGIPVPLLAHLATIWVGTLPAGPPGPTTLVVQSPSGCRTARPFTWL
jgi:uncharacterized Ntn-hydrolase superfamily protein